MQNVIALLSDRPHAQARAVAAVNVLDDAIKTGSVYNVELTEAKDALATTLRVVKDRWQEEYLTAYHAGQTNDVEEDIYYWYAVLTNLPGLHKKIAKHASRPLVAKFISLTAPFLPYAEAIKGKTFEVIKGRKPAETPKEVDLSNTGICAICGKRHKLTKAVKMVDHGFQISDGRGNYFGTRLGHCFGVGYAPYEVSNEANVAFAPVLDQWIAEETEKLTDLNTGKVTSFKTKDYQRNEAGRWVEVEVKVTKESDAKKFARLLDAAIHTQEMTVRHLEADKRDNQAKIDNWVARPLAA